MDLIKYGIKLMLHFYTLCVNILYIWHQFMHVMNIN